MNAPLAILIICLLVLAAGMRIGGVILLLAFVFVVILLAATVVARLTRSLMGPENQPARRREDKRVCPDPRCGWVNEARSRFCAQCGRRLR